jgi:hypothetical protein
LRQMHYLRREVARTPLESPWWPHNNILLLVIIFFLKTCLHVCICSVPVLLTNSIFTSFFGRPWRAISFSSASDPDSIECNLISHCTNRANTLRSLNISYSMEGLATLPEEMKLHKVRVQHSRSKTIHQLLLYQWWAHESCNHSVYCVLLPTNYQGWPWL